MAWDEIVPRIRASVSTLTALDLHFMDIGAEGAARVEADEMTDNYA